ITNHRAWTTAQGPDGRNHVQDPIHGHSVGTFLAWTKTESLIRVNSGNRRATHVRMLDAITTGLYFHGSRSMSSGRTPMPQKQSERTLILPKTRPNNSVSSRHV